jgi:nitroreductase
MSHHVPLDFVTYEAQEMLARARRMEALMRRRRSVRFFSDRAVPRSLVELAIETASSAPSGAHRQPWTFVAISNPSLKKEIRLAAEQEERESYLGGRMPEEWRDALAPLGTDWEKPFLETVPWIVVVFQHTYGVDECGQRFTNYYVKESVGMACGLFAAAIHNMGLATLTHTPSPMGFLSKLLERPANEKPYILFPIGYPSAEATVPDIERKPLRRVSVWKE